MQGKRLLHLQCHFGLDTLSWARRGAQVTGLDFSTPAIEAARQLAERASLDAEFVVSDVYDARATLKGDFDVVYTGIGALIWLKDLVAWSKVVRSLLRPGGSLYLVECHPLAEVFDDTTLTAQHGYFHDPQGFIWNDTGSYADAAAPTEQNASIEFRHPISDVLSALLDRGFSLELFKEYPHTAYARWPFLQQTARNRWDMPADLPQLPLLYSLRATVA